MTNKVSQDVQNKLAQLQMIEKNLQSFTMQRQVLQSQLLEVESALKELEGSKEAYKVVGNVMISVSKDALTNELKEKQSLLKKRVSSFESQEKSMREKLDALQKEIMKAIE